MNLRRFPLQSRTLRFIRVAPISFVFALLTASFAQAAADDDTAAQRQLREDRERFQREIERQRTESAIQAERARQAAEQQRTADELARLRAQQDRQSSELRSLNSTTRSLTESPASSYTTRLRTDAPASNPPPLIAPSDTPTPSATITPDFAITLLPDGRCVLHLKGRPPEIKSPAEVQSALQQLLSTSKSSAPSP
ncbi:hypothetical protein CMV30_18410 [Nibricoccus aquaticus]|uniref:Uncharacterized protein n=1 Tax=Nibricoccus aquaticus TaxID=2576891 RepID=A0A290QBE0_9BACT|nr:hypothetical protein [Nibricoccus aquaticus]ATC65763.1 hypothetical protein CMV30_18410 [Nibricoccus aquaticus]